MLRLRPNSTSCPVVGLELATSVAARLAALPMPLVIVLGSSVSALPVPSPVSVIGSAAKASDGLVARRMWFASTTTA